jgi:hypothetical protein
MSTPTRDDVIRMAREAGIDFQSHAGLTGQVRITTLGSQPIEKIERLVDLAQAAEREACAQLCVADESRHSLDMADDYLGQQAESFAAAIRARGNP